EKAAADAAAAQARAEAEATAAAEAKATADAAELAERMWKSLLQMLGREDGLSLAAEGGLVGSGRPPAGGLVHRGLVNTGNSCFRNSVLQGLLACEPFVEVLFRAAPGLRDSISAQEALPTWAQMARFAAAFEPPKPGVPAPLGGGSGGGGGAGEGGAWSTAKGRNRGSGGGGRYHRSTTAAAEPVYPDEAMSRAFGAFRAANMGEQEDAQEFLAFFLDQLHEEIVDAKKKHEEVWQQQDLGGGGGDGGAGGAGGGGCQEEEEEDAWLEVGKGGAKAVVNAPDPKRKV
ncbi:unnamed protein product, partial [Hapterophycus canaliculatus]